MPDSYSSSDSDTSFQTARRRLEVVEAHRESLGQDAAHTDDQNMRSLAPTDSPCVAICSTLYDDICRGCGRTAMEVANWVFLDEGERLQVWKRIKAQGYPRRKA